MINVILDAISKSRMRAITYEKYMSLCLYEPESGYYQRNALKIGRKGDFYTSSSIGTVYGEVLAFTFCKLVKEKVISPIFIEVGGGNGRFASSFLTYCKEKEFEIYQTMNYILIDESVHHQTLQKQLLMNHSIVQYCSSINELNVIEDGLMFSNELFDALPVRVVEFRDNQWEEVMVSSDEQNNLIEVFMKIEDEKLTNFLKRNYFAGKNGRRVEIPIIMEKVYEMMVSKLNRGIFLTVDYGFTKDEWDAPHRIHGSLRGYYQHELKNDVLFSPGEMDLTTHIHWDELMYLGNQFKVETISFSSQRNTLLNFGILNWLIQHASMNPFSDEFKHNRAVQSFVMPGGISDSFQVLIQTKGFNYDENFLINELLFKAEYK